MAIIYLFFLFLITNDDIRRVKNSYSLLFLNKITATATFHFSELFLETSKLFFLSRTLFVCATEEPLVFLEFLFHKVHIPVCATSD